MSTSGHSLEVRNLSVFYHAEPALRGISMKFPSNHVTALIGPSGSGKSTFLRSLNRMNDFIPEARTEGEVWLDEVNIYDPRVDPVALRCRIGMVFQQSNPFPKSVFQNVAFGLQVNGWKDPHRIERQVVKSLEAVGLWEEVKDRLSDSALDFSEGQQQRLCIARALAIKPEVILMDEPASALDPLATAKIEELIRDLKEDYTIVIVTHNLQQAARASDYTAFFHLGELIEFNETRKMFTNPDQPKTEDYVTGRFG
jgi:phosphate transport system ATP-binding protein